MKANSNVLDLNIINRFLKDFDSINLLSVYHHITQRAQSYSLEKASKMKSVNIIEHGINTSMRITVLLIYMPK